ncbi:DNA polymerase III subunit beta [Candidatus Shapirobacteria bacterium]|nr:DNA polymerase III subunit beta [Candidatus Shapirobacteria bacterium]
MQLSLLQENFTQALSAVSKFTSLKAQLPILSNILFSTDNGRLKLSATNLELGINYWLGAKIDTEGSFTLPSKEITEFISYLPAGKVDLNLNTQQLLEVSSSKANSTFSTSTPTDFPTLPSLDNSQAIELDYSVLSQAVSQVAFAAATDDSRPVLMAVLCTFTPDKLSLVATDGYRLSLKEINLTEKLSLPGGQESIIFMIPSRSLLEITKLSKNVKKIKLGASSDLHQLVFVLEDVELVSRLIEGDFPDYRRIIPSSFATTVSVNKEEFSQAIKIASVFARESANVVRFNIKKDSIELSANAPQIGQNKASVDARITGEPLEIAFNYKYVSDYLSIVKGDTVVFELNEPLTPGYFHEPSTTDFTHIIMPVRIQD